MALTRVQIAGQIRSELGVTQTELPNDLLYSYLNLVQKEVVQMLGPVVEPFFRKRIVLAGYANDPVRSVAVGGGAYTTADKKVTEALWGLTPSAHVNDEVILYGTFNAVTKVYKDIISANDATTITLTGNSNIGVDGTSCTAIILTTPFAVTPGTDGHLVPDDCLRPLYLSDLTDPTLESRIDIIQMDDTEQYITNTYWGSEVGAAIHIGDAIHILKGSSASFPAQAVLTYVMRPKDFTTNTDELLVSEGRLPEEYFGILRAGILKLSAQHLRRKEEMTMAGDDMNQRISAIQQSWGMTQQVVREEKSTR